MNVNKSLAANCKKIEHDYNRLLQYFSQFGELKKSLDETTGDSNVNKEEVLAFINKMFPGGLQLLAKDADNDLKNLSILFKQMESQLKQS